MNKIIYIIFVFTLLINFNISFAEEVATSTDETTTSTEEIATTTEISTVTLNIKNGSDILFQGEIEIDESTITVFDNTDTEHEIINNNILAVLRSADLLDDSFEISDLAYYSSFDSFLINCINYLEDNLCYNWQYVVDNTYPFVGIDDYILEGGETIFLYFGQPRRLVLPDSATTTIEFSIIAEEYDYINDSWGILENYTVGIFLDDPENPWTPNVVATSSLNEFGEATFIINTAGDYKTGLSEDYYYPFYNLTISSSSIYAATTTATSTDDTTTTATSTDSNSSGSSGSGNSSSNSQFDIQDAIDYLESVQSSDGGFGADLYSDWAAIAFASADESNQSLKNYIKNGSVSDDLYDLLRRSMALLALDLDPQEDYRENLIEKILEEFDGQQFGDSDLFNDDIFALIVLQNVGYDINDTEISSTIDFIIDNQSRSGAFESVDVTAAAIQALKEFESYNDVEQAISNAENFLRNQQNSDGSWSNSYATSWVMLAMTTLGNNFDDWNGDPMDYLGNIQNSDGGLLEDETLQNRIWSTSYAIAGSSEKDWVQILNDFSKKDEKESEDEDDSESSSGSGGGVSSNSSDEEDVEFDLEENYESIDPSETLELSNTFASSVVDNVFELPQAISTTSASSSEDATSTLGINTETQESNQVAAVSESMNWPWFIYLMLGIIALIISVIMFRR